MGQRAHVPFIRIAAFAVAMSCTTDATPGIVMVTSGATDQVYILDAATGVVHDSVALDPRRGEIDEPHGIAVSPALDFWYATVAHGEPTLWKFATRDNRLVGRLRLPMAGASRIGLTADGALGYIPDYYRDDADVLGEITTVRLHDLTIVHQNRVCTAPHDAQPAPDGQWIAVTCTMSNELLFLDPGTLNVARRVEFTDFADAKPMNVVWGSDGSAYVTLHNAALVARVHPGTGVTETGPVGPGPAQLAMSPKGDVLVVANRMDGSASIVSAKHLTDGTRIPLGVSHPHGAAVSSTGALAFITYEGTTETRGGVVAVEVATKTVAWRRSIGTYTLGVIHVTPR